MSQDRLKALAELSKIIGEKGTVPPELWERAGVKPGARQKDVERAIKEEKKNKSKNIKETVKIEQQKLLEDEEKKLGTTVEEIMGKKDLISQELAQQDKDKLKRERIEARKLKEQRNANPGYCDMETDYMPYSNEGNED
uniref:Uncharacterized protein n=1 Tax=Trypanosoma congolense (strain IL3000) TaxID=1068625 RepID=G0V2L2_TRYCI|nr:hypothetical protein, unlikely [Trypanosoma congolense IL3000]